VVLRQTQPDLLELMVQRSIDGVAQTKGRFVMEYTTLGRTGMRVTRFPAKIEAHRNLWL
jgi:hypothetical protein